MKRLVCHCSCGETSWTMDWATDEPGMTLYEGIADDCDNCKAQTNGFVPTIPKHSFHKEEGTDDFKAMMKKRKQNGKPRGQR